MSVDGIGRKIPARVLALTFLGASVPTTRHLKHRERRQTVCEFDYIALGVSLCICEVGFGIVDFFWEGVFLAASDSHRLSMLSFILLDQQRVQRF